MKKILEFLGVIILLSIIILIVVFIFNPFSSRDKLLSNIINSYLSGKIEGYETIPEEDRLPYEEKKFNHPLIPDEQEKALYDMGVDVSSLPTEISSDMSKCFIEKLGEQRANEIINGSTPSAIDIFKANDCLNK